MNTEAKLSVARAAVLSISKHDDLPIKMVRAALEEIGEFIAAELVSLESSRAERAEYREKMKAERLAARAKGGADS
jgi:hypothetical protein